MANWDYLANLKEGKAGYKRNQFSRIHTLIFVLVFGCIGGVLLLLTHAAIPNPNLPGDLNNNNKVDVFDLSLLLSHYGTTGTKPWPGDANDDGMDNALDLSIILTNYGKTYTANNVNCSDSSAIWQSGSFTQQTGTSTLSFYATPSAANDNLVAGLSSAAATDYTGLAAIVRFNPTNTIDARNGAAYAAVNNVPYTAGQSYYFELSVNVAAHTYDAYVTPAGGARAQIASGYAFRTEQAGASSLSNFNIYGEAGTMHICNPLVNGLSISFNSVPPPPPPPPPSGTLLFDGTWPASGPASTSIWSGPGTANNVVTVTGMRDPLGSLENVGFFRVARDDTLPCCAYAGRADYESPELMSPTKNNDVYISIPVYIPMSNVAAMYKNHNGWMVAEPYGPPYGGSPAAGGIDVSPISASSIQYDFTWNDYGSWDAASCEYQNDGSMEKQWVSPIITTDSWHTFIMHIHWARDKTGFEELWYDGVPQQYHAAPRSGCTGAPPQTGTGGANTRLYFANYVSGNNDGAPNFIDVNLYGNESTDGSIYTTYHGETKIGTTLSIVQPDVYPAGP